MGLFSFLRRDRSAANERPPRGRRAGDLPSADVVRAQARRRLIGAAVLVVAAVLVLPLVFDSKPRPLPVDIPIEVPRRDLAVALPDPPPPRGDAASVPASAPAPVAPSTVPAAASAAESASVPAPVVRSLPAKPVEAPKPVARPEPTRPEPRAEAKPEPKAERKTAEVRKEPAKPVARPEPKPESKPESKPEPKPSVNEAARAQAALEGRAVAAAPSRFVVQVGAFEQADGAREAKQRVAKAGLTAHESVVQTADGKRIRVRLGPFASREEADRAAAKLRAAGVSGAVMPQP